MPQIYYTVAVCVVCQEEKVCSPRIVGYGLRVHVCLGCEDLPLDQLVEIFTARQVTLRKEELGQIASQIANPAFAAKRLVPLFA